MYIYIYIYTYVCVCVYIYIYNKLKNLFYISVSRKRSNDATFVASTLTLYSRSVARVRRKTL